MGSTKKFEDFKDKKPRDFSVLHFWYYNTLCKSGRQKRRKPAAWRGPHGLRGAQGRVGQRSDVGILLDQRTETIGFFALKEPLSQQSHLPLHHLRGNEGRALIHRQRQGQHLLSYAFSSDLAQHTVAGFGPIHALFLAAPAE